jgi:hypothetical protein
VVLPSRRAHTVELRTRQTLYVRPCHYQIMPRRRRITVLHLSVTVLRVEEEAQPNRDSWASILASNNSPTRRRNKWLARQFSSAT